MKKNKSSEEFRKTKNLLKMAKEAEILAKKYKIKGPKDLSKNHDKYCWDNYKV